MVHFFYELKKKTIRLFEFITFQESLIDGLENKDYNFISHYSLSKESGPL